MFDVAEGTAVDKYPSDYGISVLRESGEELPSLEHPVATVLRTRTPISNGLLAIRHAGSEKVLWAFGNAVPQFDANGNVIRVITSFADVTEMKNAERAIRQLSNQLLRLQDEERRRIGRELHDGLAQTVLAINLSLAQARDSLEDRTKVARSLEKARSLTQQMSREIRTLSYLLHPPLLDDLGLVSALREYAQGFSERSSIDTQLYVLSPFQRLPQAVELALFRIVQESLANIQRHSGSRSARIRLRQEGLVVTLEVVDFGRGMVLETPRFADGDGVRLGVGIPGMRERVSQLGGRLEIVSGPGGTTVCATIWLAELTDRNDVADVSSQTL
jgi:signal transduction histidine kinase